ncbi:MAG: hypothetical protein FWD26_06110 [Treponema sp.]|nr:hypothetical protein [Treponema sp.]
MKTWKQNSIIGILAIIAVIFAFTTCDNGTNNQKCPPHDWNDYEQTTNPTCNTEGIKTRTCKDCGTIDTVKETGDQMLEHDFDWQVKSFGAEIETCQHNDCNETRGDIRLTLALGDTGPAGGIIFYKDSSGFTMTDDDSTAYYLEAAPANMPTNLRWSTLSWAEFTASGNDVSLWIDIPGTETAIGTGRKNTALILALDPTATAALACDNYSIEDFNDWFLPSKDELNQLYLRRDDFGLSSGRFWSSSQSSLDSAWFHFFLDGNQNTNYKGLDFIVRSVRAF